MAEIIGTIIILFICLFPLFAVGIVQYWSKNPVGFWAGKEPPAKEQITDVRAYNRRHGMMWMAYAVGLFLCFMLGFPFGGVIVAIAFMVGAFGGLLLMIWYHNRLERKYLKKPDADTKGL